MALAYHYPIISKKHGGAFVVAGLAAVLSGPILILRSNLEMSNIKKDFMWEYQFSTTPKLESSIELKSQGAGLSLNYTF